MSVKPIPEGYRTVTPYLTVQGASKFITFLGEAFGAEETFRTVDKEGAVRHAEVRIGDSMVMIGESNGEWGPTPIAIYMYVEDVDAVYRRAIAAGGASMSEPADHFYGDRSGGVKDPFGNVWWIATHFEDVAAEEVQRRSAAMAK
jgi:PhnB protein